MIATISFLGNAVEDNKKSIINIEKATQKLYKKFQTNEINLNYDEEAILLEQATSKIIREIDVQKGIIQNGMKNSVDPNLFSIQLLGHALSNLTRFLGNNPIEVEMI